MNYQITKDTDEPQMQISKGKKPACKQAGFQLYDVMEKEKL